jgi:hypothetical protein
MRVEPSPVSLTRDSMEGAFGEYHGYLETESDPANLRNTTQHAIPWPGKHRASLYAPSYLALLIGRGVSRM